MSQENHRTDLDRRNYDRQRRNERTSDQRNKNNGNDLNELRSPLRTKASSPNGPSSASSPYRPITRGRGTHYGSPRYQPSRRCQYNKWGNNDQRLPVCNWRFRPEEFPILEEKRVLEQSPEIVKLVKKSWYDMMEEEENEALQKTSAQSIHEVPKGLLTPDSTPKDKLTKSWARVVRGDEGIEKDCSRNSLGIKRRLDLSRKSSNSSCEDQENRGKKGSKIEYERDPLTLGRRQKQIDYGKNTASYTNYLKTVPREKREAGDPFTPVKHVKYSRRSWDSQIRIWKQKLQRWNPTSNSEGVSCQSLDAELSELILDNSLDLELDLDFDIDSIPDSSFGSVADTRSESSVSGKASGDFAFEEKISGNSMPTLVN